MLEHVGMQTAFDFMPPGPTTGAVVVVSSHRNRTWRASNASVAALIKRMRGQVMIRYVSLHFASGPVKKRIHFQESIILQFQNLRVCAFRSLVASNAADPRFQSTQRLLHRLDFMNIATQVRVLDGKRARILSRKNIPARVAIKINDVEIPFVLNLLAEDQRIPKMIAGVEEENFDVRLDARDHVQERHAVRLERGAHGDLGREFIHCPLDDLLRRLRFELG